MEREYVRETGRESEKERERVAERERERRCHFCLLTILFD